MKRILLVCFLSLFTTIALGQEFLKGKDLSQVKAAQFSEAEIAQIGKELKANQMTLEQAEPLALAKGMSASEFTQLKVRLQSNTVVPTEVKEEQKKTDGHNARRQYTSHKKCSCFWLRIVYHQKLIV